MNDGTSSDGTSSATTTHGRPLPPPAERAHPVATDLALVSVFAAFIAASALVPGIPTGVGVPITLQTFAVVLAGLVLGWRRGGLAALLYLAVGLAGVPVFANGSGGLGVLAGASAGYLVAFPLGAALAGLLANGARHATGGARYLVLVASGLTASALTIHPLGIAGIALNANLSAQEAFAAGAVYFPGDTVKNLLAAAVALAVFAHYPDLLRRRR
ncbi:biotin transporter BioY [Cellulomonas sp. DKR-3]|uniref:Biotin transporter n=1 Tax=Cellulomonas fulva TaxID=2835530 RepID=A0ABS5U1K8_9CELL|nr:biotin transporter BioY [Cellulomonas fulva]